MNEPSKPVRTVRVAFEPNRFSGRCLEKIYGQLYPSRTSKSDDESIEQIDQNPPIVKREDQR